MLSVKVRAVLDTARFFLNDVNQTYYTDAILLYPFAVAYRDLKEDLFNNDIRVVSEVSAVLSITSGITDIGGPNGPALPINFVVPITVWERLSGSSDDYIPMRQLRELIKTDRLANWLGEWTYHKQYIEFPAANTDREIKIDYIGDTITLANSAESQINVFNAESFLSYRTAALSSRFYGENETRAEELNGNAQSAIDKLLNTDIKNQQSMPVRRRPFRSNVR